MSGYELVALVTGTILSFQAVEWLQIIKSYAVQSGKISKQTLTTLFSKLIFFQCVENMI